jgi:hypothetical protein
VRGAAIIKLREAEEGEVLYSDYSDHKVSHRRVQDGVGGRRNSASSLSILVNRSILQTHILTVCCMVISLLSIFQLWSPCFVTSVSPCQFIFLKRLLAEKSDARNRSYVVLSFCSALIGVEEAAAAAALGFYLLRFKVSEHVWLSLLFLKIAPQPFKVCALVLFSCLPIC